MTPGFPVLVPSPAPPRLLLTGYFDARLSGFRCLSPAPQRLLLTGYFTARISGFRCPGTFFSLPVFGRLFRRPPFSHPTFPSRLFGWPARSLCRLTVGLRFLPPRGFYRSAVFTAPRFLPLRGFFLPLRFHRFLGGLCSSAALVLAVPQSSPHFRAARSLGHLPVRLRILPLRDFYRSTVFTAPRFLPLRGFYRSAVFTAPRFLPLRGFYRSAVFTAPRFLPLRDFFRSAIFSAPISPVLWGALLFLSALQSSPSSGRTLCYRLLRRVSGGTPFLIFFLDHLLNRSRSVTAPLTGFPFVPFIHIRGSSVVSSSD